MNRCILCPLFENACDFISPDCLLSIREVVARKDLLKPDYQDRIIRFLDAVSEAREERVGRAKLGFKKYDRRRKPDTPQRTLWRIYKQQRNSVSA